MADKIKEIAMIYYSRKDIQKAIFDFCKNRETISRHSDKFGKRPDSLEYPSEILNAVKKGYSSFHCSEEIWENPMEISKELNELEINKLRKGWDLLIDIDCKWFDYSKKAALSIIKALQHHNIKNIGIKFSGGKGFHIIVPWEAFPKIMNQKQTKDLFPEIPRKIAAYLRDYSEKLLKDSLPESELKQLKKSDIKKGIKCKNCNEISSSYFSINYFCPNCKRQEFKKFSDSKKIKNYKCPDCSQDFEIKDKKQVYECQNCDINSEKNPENFTEYEEYDLFELMGLDVVLVSPRHLFRSPYSLHEKGLASLPLEIEEIEDFQPKEANPLKVKIKKFYPVPEKEEARELLISALDWSKEQEKENSEKKEKKDFKKVNIDKRNIIYPPCIEEIMKGMKDGRKRSLFILINYFRSLNLDFPEIQEKLEKWNKKNTPQLKSGYIKSQISWHKRNKIVLPPNCNKDYYKGMGICKPDNLCRKIKNPVNYSIKKQFSRKNNEKV